ncbi:15802_t:CDS:2 [Funneliformis caledonium]|uniref:15802_t:CDS:1 n=2 Tax=Funneliformis TaxID=1117308 RepID=A0A9N8W4W9_9GLOM|nr:15802_t:CDS:2 [Funneliformis caledonium]CAG8505226.1 8830_t:CDS:2 [Funneliformis mosseae]
MNSPPTKLSLEQLNNHYILFRHGQSKANSAKIVVSHPENGIPSSGVGPPSPASSSSEGNGWGLTQLGKEQVKSASQNMLNYLYNNFPSGYHLNDQQKKRDDDRNNEEFNNPSQNQFSLSKRIHIKIYSSPFLRTIETANILLTELLNNGRDEPYVDVTVHPEVIVHDDLRERNFGIFELRSDHESYSKVWAIDESITTPSNNEYKEIGVESCEQVRSRMCDVIREIEQHSELLKEHLVVVFVSHGDSLQILQTAFENVEANLHRSLNHIGTAEWKVFWS